MTYDGLAHTSLLTYPSIRDRLIMLDGWSKTYAMTGWRLGYAVWPDALVDKVREARRQRLFLRQRPDPMGRPRSPHRPAGGRGAPWWRSSTAAAGVVVDGLNSAARRVGPRPKGAFYAFPNISGTGWRAKPLASALLEQAGVATIGGPDFGVHGEGYIRLSYANSVDNIERALARMHRFLSDTRPGEVIAE